MSTNGKPDKQPKAGKQEPVRDPWEAEPTWRPERREGFELYRDMPGKRSIEKVAGSLGKSPKLLERWSREDGWVARAAAWDAECDRRRREEFFAGDAEVSREQAETAALARFGVHAFIDDFVEEVRLARKENRRPFEGLTASERIVLLPRVVKALREAQQVERLARGMSTANVGGHDGGELIPADIASKSDKDVDAYLLGYADGKAMDREQAEADR